MSATPDDGMARLQVPPHSVEAEQSVLGALLIDNRGWDAVGALLSVSDFYRHEHRVTFDALAAMLSAGKTADVLTLHDELRRAGKLETAGGLAYINALAQGVPSASHIVRYAEIVRERTLLRRVAALARELEADAMGARVPARETIDRAVTELLAMQQSQTTGEPVRLQELLPPFLDGLSDRIDGKNDGIATGLDAVDRLTSGGGRPGEVWVIGARPSMGKTALVLHLSRCVGERHAVLMLTQEDSNASLTMRHVAAAGRVNLSAIRSPRGQPDETFTRVTDGMERLQPVRVWMDDQAGLTLMDVRRKVQQVLRSDPGLKLVIIDYLQLMEGDGENRNQMLGQIANGLKKLAKDLRVWVVLLSQLNREADKRGGVPQMADLRDSGDIEGAADVIGLLHREWRRKPTDENKHWAQLHVAKHKNGPTDTLSLWFDGETQQFGNWDGPPPQRGAHYAGEA